MRSIDVVIHCLEHAKDLPLPDYATDGSVGVDLLAAISAPVTMSRGSHNVVPTGISLEIPTGYEGQIRPRSGLAASYGITILNSPGTIDSDYRGEVSVILINFGNKNFTINRGFRIAQLVFSPVIGVNWIKRRNLEKTSRGKGGFGSTGIES